MPASPRADAAPRPEPWFEQAKWLGEPLLQAIEIRDIGPQP